MYTSAAQLQVATCSHSTVETPHSLQSTRKPGIRFSFNAQIKHCAVCLLPVLFSGFPCKITDKNPILPRPGQREATPRLPFGSADTLRPDGSFDRELRTFNELASPES